MDIINKDDKVQSDTPDLIHADIHPKGRKSELKILHLYHDLMNLYGDWANAAVLARELTARSLVAVIDKKSVGDDVDFDIYDFVYIGSGTERSQYACMRDINRYKDALTARITDGMHVLATGNSHELFGRSVTEADGERYDTLGLLDFETIRDGARVTGDCVYKASFMPEKLIGFVNRAGRGQEGTVDRPFFAELGPGANDATSTEGIHYKNLIGTYMTGPVLVRNPPLLKLLTDILTSSGIPPNGCVSPDGSVSPDKSATPHATVSDPFFKYQASAYQIALNELSARIKK
jgi:hypothetical protein